MVIFQVGFESERRSQVSKAEYRWWQDGLYLMGVACEGLDFSFLEFG
jgi:hypothetical protein